jgi:hypothetical protein
VIELSDRARIAGEALAAAGGSATAGDIGAAAGFDHNRQARAISDLEKLGLAIRHGRQVELTPAGRQAFSRRPRPDAGLLGEALSFWPHRHRAAAELLLSAIVARHHLPDLRPPPGFVLIGRTGMGKSALVEVVFELLGLDQTEHTVMVPEQSEGDLFGRRIQVEGGAWRLDPAPMTRRPAALFDEFDKGDTGQRTMVWTYFQARREVKRGDQVVRLDPVPVIAANYPAGADPYAQLRPEYLRRAILLDVGTNRASTAHLEEALSAFYRDRPWQGEFPLEQLVPPVHDAGDFQGFFASVQHLLTDEGQERFIGAGALEALTLGRAALYRSEELSSVAMLTVVDYLTCLESVDGLVQEQWYDTALRVSESMAGVSRTEMVSRLDAAQQARQAQRDQARVVRVREESEDLDHVRTRSEFVAALQHRWGKLDGRSQHKDFRADEQLRNQAAGVRDQLTRLKASAANAGPTRLAELRHLAGGPMAEADRLIKRSEELRADEERRKQQAKADRDAARRHPAMFGRHQQELVKAQRDGLRNQLRQVREEVKPFEGYWRRSSTRKNESPFRVLKGLQAPAGGPLIEFQQRPPPPDPGGLKGFFIAMANAQTAGQGIWTAPAAPHLQFQGTANSCAALDAWGQNTRAVLEPAIAVLHEAEDRLSAALGVATRGSRPSVQRPPQQNVRALRPASGLGQLRTIPGTYEDF